MLDVEVIMVVSSSGVISLVLISEFCMSIIYPYGGCGMLWHVWSMLVTCLACELL